MIISKFKSSKIAFFLSFLSFSFSDHSVANEEENKEIGILKVCTSGGFIPFSVYTKDGWEGFDIDLAENFSAFLKTKLEVINYSFDGIIPALITKKCDLIFSGMTITDERKKTVLFSDPYFKDGLSFMYLKNNAKIENINDIAELNHKKYKIGVKVGYTSDFYVGKNLKNATVLKFNETSDIINALRSKKIDIIVTDSNHSNILVKKFPTIMDSKKTDVQEEYFGVAARNDSAILIDKFNTFLAQWKKDGEYDKSYNKYF
ncbi:substrate-binding periplasmic protein [Fluviispira multicolorata]|uniref:Transporter substrate-binding domain-containing protein n=1 Tax=Fluviispira multicolorata TaxID=2654512 RepID=A0A833JDF5_9BACT|nr:transporter substrate-binding domain-containing protein [Fluviispira multicolorata]KAB8031754.1 transporter substrate-binding domain-containing protein [Fluviispira multicolorata]